MDRNVSFIVNRMNERVIAGQSIETLLAVLMFVMMGITLERSKIANDLLTTMARVFGPLPGGLAVSRSWWWARSLRPRRDRGRDRGDHGPVEPADHAAQQLLPELATGVIAASGTLGQIIPPSIVIVLLGTLGGRHLFAPRKRRARSCSPAVRTR